MFGRDLTPRIVLALPITCWLASCQLIAGLSDLETGAAPAGGSAGDAGQGPGGQGGQAGQGGGGQGGDAGSAGAGGSPCATVYVAEGASGDGSSWQSAHGSLQAALAEARSGRVCEIWVKEGSYSPGALPADTFALVDGVPLRGGFIGNETSPGGRDPFTHETRLSGDIDGDDGGDDHDDIVGQNNRHVVSAVALAPGAVLDGFYVVGGDSPDDGAGIHVDGGSLRLDRVVLRGNHAAARGGALFYSGSDDNAGVFLDEVTANGNRAAEGGALFLEGGDHDIEINNLYGNLADDLGGAMRVLHSTLEIRVAFLGGNHTTGSGGCLAQEGGRVSLSHTRTRGSSATNDGGALYLLGAEIDVLDTVLSGNRANGTGGAIWASGGSVDIINTTITGNGSITGSAGVQLVGTPGVGITNSILWHNGPDDSLLQQIIVAGTVNVQYSIVQGSGGSSNWQLATANDAGGNKDEDPVFVLEVSPAGPPNEDGNVALFASTSPAFNAGLDGGDPNTTDLGGEMRILCGAIDMGPFELTSCP